MRLAKGNPRLDKFGTFDFVLLAIETERRREKTLKSGRVVVELSYHRGHFSNFLHGSGFGVSDWVAY